MSHGRRLLLAVLSRTETVFAARRCRVTPAAVRNWRAGYNRPGPRARRLLFFSYGIDPASWSAYTI